MEKYHKTYGRYPKYPVADAGYGSYNNYVLLWRAWDGKIHEIYDVQRRQVIKYRENPYHAANFQRDGSGTCLPKWKKILLQSRRPVYKNKYGRTEELYECESCEGCPHKCKLRSKGIEQPNHSHEWGIDIHTSRSNIEPESIHGALLRMNRRIQAEGTFGILKWDRFYKRLFREARKM